MVTAILHATEQDGTILPPRRVTIRGHCTDPWCHSLHVQDMDGQDIFCTPEELQAEDEARQ